MRHLLLIPLAVASLCACAPVTGAPLLHDPGAQTTAKRLETGAEATLTTAEDLWHLHRTELSDAHRAQVVVLIKKVPALRQSLRQAERLGNADSLQVQIASAFSLAKAITSIVTGDSPAAAAEVAARPPQ